MELIVLRLDAFRPVAYSGPRFSYLRKAIGVGGKDCHIAWLRVGVVKRNILFHGKAQGLILVVRNGTGVLADMLGRHHMLNNTKWR